MAARWLRSMWSRAASACGCKASSSARGLARVYSFPDNHACVDDLLAREAEARAKGAGLWGTWAYRVLDAGNVERLGRLTRSYQLVEGVVAEVGESGGRLYLNFDKDWRKDFTILMERKDGEAFKAAGVDPKALAGKKLRVRGWVEWRNGPMIHATHAEQIELLPDGGSPSAPSPSRLQRRRTGNKRQPGRSSSSPRKA